MPAVADTRETAPVVSRARDAERASALAFGAATH
jgi:hypothetical protein